MDTQQTFPMLCKVLPGYMLIATRLRFQGASFGIDRVRRALDSAEMPAARGIQYPWCDDYSQLPELSCVGLLLRDFHTTCRGGVAGVIAEDHKHQHKSEEYKACYGQVCNFLTLSGRPINIFKY